MSTLRGEKKSLKNTKSIENEKKKETQHSTYNIYK